MKKSMMWVLCVGVGRRWCPCQRKGKVSTTLLSGLLIWGVFVPTQGGGGELWLSRQGSWEIISSLNQVTPILNTHTPVVGDQARPRQPKPPTRK